MAELESAVKSDRLLKVRIKALVLQRYLDAQRMCLAWDNRPNHHSSLVRQAIEAMLGATVLPLPTYAPWLNRARRCGGG